jgi:hypothetical protein
MGFDGFESEGYDMSISCPSREAAKHS